MSRNVAAPLRRIDRTHYEALNADELAFSTLMDEPVLFTVYIQITRIVCIHIYIYIYVCFSEGIIRITRHCVMEGASEAYISSAAKCGD